MFVSKSNNGNFLDLSFLNMHKNFCACYYDFFTILKAYVQLQNKRSANT